MARFIFPLQALLEQRESVERTRQLAVAAIERERLALEAQVASCQQQIKSHKSDLRDLLSGEVAGAQTGGVDTRTVRLQASASLHAQASAQRLALQLAGAYRRLQSAQVELRKATTARKAVEVLKSRRFEAWKREQNRRETSALDELATMAAGRAPAEQGSDEAA
jgi:flagellar export protein FliJ